ncbi:hypothetical protein Gotri_004177, partial [Gossypium trilobum]|nr:hypothetical protein [Gossypium trilobum]
MDIITIFVQENDVMSNRSLTKHLSSLEWKPLENEIARINFDTVFNHRHFRSVVGLVVRNDRGEVLVFKLVVENRIASSFAAEVCTYAHAARLGCSTASDENVKMGMSKPTSLENLVIHKCKSTCLELDEAL